MLETKKGKEEKMFCFSEIFDKEKIVQGCCKPGIMVRRSVQIHFDPPGYGWRSQVNLAVPFFMSPCLWGLPYLFSTIPVFRSLFCASP